MNNDDQYLQIAQGAIKKLKELNASNKWQENGNKPCAMFKTEIDGRIASKGIDKVKFNIEKVIAFLEKEESLKIINPMLLEIKALHVVENKFRVNYMQYKGIWPVDNRDFVNVSAKEWEGDTFYIATAACNFPHPEVKSVVRGEVFVGGYIIQKIDENTTQVTYISDADLKGSIPGMIKNTLSAKQGEIASKIQESMVKNGY